MSILGIIWFIICTACAFLLGNIVMIDIPLWTLLLLIPLFIVSVFLPVLPTESKKLRTRRLRITNKGSRLLKIFLASMILVLGFNIPAMCGVWETSGIPAIGDAGWKWTGHILLIVLIENIVFWNGMIRIYLSSEQLRVKYRLVGFLCGMIPIVHLVVLLKMIRVCDKEVKFENDKIILNESRAAERICATKYPILMVHGVFFRDFRFFNYWGRIPEQLEINGAKVFYGNQQSAASVEESGKELAERIKKVCEETGSEKVNIIAHSKGGLDCRMAIAKYGAGPHVASLATVNTPHRGCEFADYLLSKIGEPIKEKVAAMYDAALRKLGDPDPDFIAAVTDLTHSACEKLNQEMPDPQGIYCQSFGSKLNRPSSGQFPLNFSTLLVKHFDGPNDGLVGEKSFSWGQDYQFWTVRGKRGISHGDVIDLNRENIDGFDVREVFVQIVSDLKNKGF